MYIVHAIIMQSCSQFIGSQQAMIIFISVLGP